MKLHASGEDYLETILVLQKKLGIVRSVDVAWHMGVSKPSVCVAVNTLKDGGFLTMDEDHFLHLTDAGRKAAEKIYERHCFFTEQLIAAGVDPKIAEADACKIEHVISNESFCKTCKDPVVLIEQRLDFSRFVKDGFGTGDCVIIADGTLDIVDYKHGKGVEVSSVENPQMMLYALGALELFDGIYDIDTVRMTIFQPRRDNVSVCIMSKDDLLQWAYNDLTYKAKLAYEGGGEFACGDWCRFCKAKAVCRKRAEYNLELAKYDFEMPDTLEDAEIAAILDKADELTAWAADVKEYALRQALSGTEYPGYKVVEGRSNRRYISEEAVADAVSQAGYDPYRRCPFAEDLYR